MQSYKQILKNFEDRPKSLAEAKKQNPTDADRNMQLALTRLCLDSDEQELAWKHGDLFQKKYHLSDKQMEQLAALAVAIGFYEDTPSLESWLSAYAASADKADTGKAGSCSCSCP
jgi:hypothetical protein